MRAISVDERDSTWERDDARYRVYVFEGPGSAVSTTDLLGATVEEALDTARALSDDNARLWSLALVESDARGMRGLLWLSGMDYNDAPGTPGEWRRRRQMQDRYLAARSRGKQHPILPNGLRLIRMFPEWVDGLPLWENYTEHYRLAAGDLGLSDALDEDLSTWNQAWLARGLDDPLPGGWLEQGQALFLRLKDELEGVAEVRPEFWPETAAGAASPT